MSTINERQKGLKMTPDEAKAVLDALLEDGEVRIEVIDAKLQNIREKTGQQVTAATEISEGEEPLSPEQVEQKPSYYKDQYENLDNTSKARCSWEVLQDRLLENSGHKLKLAEALEGKGVLFGVDENGKALFADKGVEPILKGMNYQDTRDRVLYQYDETGQKVMQDGNPVLTGYELFPYAGEYDKSEEISFYEENTGEPIVASSNRNEYRSIWLESGRAPSLARNALFYPHDGHAYVNFDNPQHYYERRGARRLLRV